MPLTPFAGFADAVPAELAGRAAVVVVVGLAVRVAGLVAVSGRWLYPGLTPQLRLGLVAVVAVATMPAAVVAAGQAAAGPAAPVLLVLGTELLVGGSLGLAVALLVSAVAAAGGMLATVAGVDWAATFTPGGGEGSGIARLCGWLGLAAFVAAGGQRLVIGGLLESCWRLPVGSLAAGLGRAAFPLPEMLVQLPAVGLSLAFALALPVLVALVATHVASAICLRTVSFTPGPGLLQTVATAVLLLGLLVGSRQWAERAGLLLLPPLEASFAAAAGPVARGGPDVVPIAEGARP